jgi:hypothetical protein
MAFNLGQALGGAGVVLRGWRQAEDAERQAALNQMNLEQRRRLMPIELETAQVGLQQGQLGLEQSQFNLEQSRVKAPYELTGLQSRTSLDELRLREAQLLSPYVIERARIEGKTNELKLEQERLALEIRRAEVDEANRQAQVRQGLAAAPIPGAPGTTMGQQMDVANVPVPPPPPPPAPRAGVAAPVVPPTPLPVTPESQQEYEESQAVPAIDPFAATAPGQMAAALRTPDGLFNERAYDATRADLVSRMEQSRTRGGTGVDNQEYNFLRIKLAEIDRAYRDAQNAGQVRPRTAPLSEQRQRREEPKVFDPTLGVEIPASQARRYQSLSSQMPAQVTQNPTTRAFLERAQLLGVNPAAAIATFALENSYGGTATSGADARGTMQVTKVAYDDVLQTIRNPAEARRLGLTATQQQVAATLPPNFDNASADQLQDAGLLYLALLERKYNIAPNLIGAAYHAGPSKEIREGNLPNKYDRTAGIWSADHNAMYVGLYNQFIQLAGFVGEEVEQPGQQAAPAAAPTGAMPTGAMPTGATPQAGLQPPTGAPTAAAPAAGAQPTPPQTARLKAGDFYLANPESTTRDMRNAMDQRNELVRIAEVYRNAGMGMEFSSVLAQIRELDQNLYYLAGMQGVQELSQMRDPRRLAGVWSEAAGVPVGIQPRDDGSWNLFYNGALVDEGASTSAIIDMARSSFDINFRADKAARAASFAEKMEDLQIKIQEGNASELAKMIREVSVEQTKGNNQMALEWVKANAGWDIKPTGAGDGSVIVRPPNSPPYLFNPMGRAIEIDGVRIPANSAVLIQGLPQQTQTRLNQIP